MSAVRQLKAVARDQVGKGAARAVRRSGRVPAVIYGGGAAPRSISLDGNEMRMTIFAGHFLTTVFEVDVAGETARVIPRDYQLDPVRDVPIHIDFLRVVAGQTIEVEVPVHFLNQDKSAGLKRGGVLNIVRHSIELQVPTDAIPDAVEVDLAGLDIGDTIHVSAVKLPANVTTAIDRDFTVATIAAPAVMGEEAEAEEAAVAEASKAEAETAKSEEAAAEAE